MKKQEEVEQAKKRLYSLCYGRTYNTCTSCSGRGGKYNNTVYARCGGCTGTGRTMCYRCGGSGRIVS